jgi:hypothetical protein
MDVLWLPIQRTERWHENAKLPQGDAANSQPDRGCNANGAGEAKQDGPMVNSAKKQRSARLRAAPPLPNAAVVLSGGVPELDFLIGLLKFFGYHIETR